MRLRQSSPVIAFAFLFLAKPLLAGWVVTQETTMEGNSPSANRKTFTTSYLDKDRTRIEIKGEPTGKSRAPANSMMLIYNGGKNLFQCMALSSGKSGTCFKVPVAMLGMNFGGFGQAGIKVKLTKLDVVPLGESKEILGQKCTRYKSAAVLSMDFAGMMSGSTTITGTSCVAGFFNYFTEISELVRVVDQANSDFIAPTAMEGFRKARHMGGPVLETENVEVSNMMGRAQEKKTSMHTVSIKQQSIPPQMFQLPAGYQVRESPMMGGKGTGMNPLMFGKPLGK